MPLNLKTHVHVCKQIYIHMYTKTLKDIRIRHSQEEQLLADILNLKMDVVRLETQASRLLGAEWLAVIFWGGLGINTYREVKESGLSRGRSRTVMTL